jgi:hypothetical protein
MAKGIRLTDQQKAIRAKLEEIRLLAENTPQASQSKPQTAVIRILKGLRGDINVLGQQVDDALAALIADEPEDPPIYQTENITEAPTQKEDNLTTIMGNADTVTLEKPTFTPVSSELWPEDNKGGQG